MDGSLEHVRIEGVQLEGRWWHGPAAATAPPFVLLHEGLGSISMWREFPAALAARTGRAVFAYSRRGHGRSAPRGAALSIDFMHVEAHGTVPRVLDAVGIERAVLLGHSDGGSMALLAAAAWPARVAALVLEAPHVFVEPIAIRSITRIREAYASTDLRAKLARHHAHVDDAFRGWNDVWLHPDFAAWTIEAALSHVRCPTLVLQGDGDEYGTWAQVEAIAQGVRAPVETHLIQNCGHSPHRDHQSIVLDDIASFIDRWNGSTRGNELVSSS